MAEEKIPKAPRKPDIVIGNFEIKIDSNNWTVSESGKSSESYCGSLANALAHIKHAMLRNKITDASKEQILGIEQVLELCKESKDEFKKLTEGY